MPVDNKLLARIKKGGVLFDGGMGSMLIAKGLATGTAPEEWNDSHESVVREIHRAYLDAGADVIETNTFGGTPGKLKSHGLETKMKALNGAGIRLAKEAIAEFEASEATGKSGGASGAGARFFVFSTGATGMMLPPVGNATEDQIRSEFASQISALEETPDLILIETVYDLREGLIALETAKSSSDAPVGVTLTFDKNPRGFFTIMGNEAVSSLRKIEEAGADLTGANCTITSKEMVELATMLRDKISLPLLCQPNAGQPVMRDRLPCYDQPPEEFAEDMMKVLETGVNAVGGCCGTSPDFIRNLAVRMGKVSFS